MIEREIEAKYVDLHCHGGAGFYFSDPNPRNIQSAIDFHKNHGTSKLLASLVTEKIDDLEIQIRRLIPFYNSGAIAGIHLEGPYLARARCGAHNPNLLKSPTISEVQKLIEVGDGAVRMITIAPELENALDVISYLAKNNIIAAIGHSDGGYDDALKAVNAGAALVTHFSNGMSKLKDGERTFATALLHETSIPLEVIMDGHHVTREDIAVIAEVAGDRMVFVTDAMAAAGQPDGDYRIGDLDVVVSEGVARLKSNGALAGSTLTMNQAVANARIVGLSENVILNASQTNPTKLLNGAR
ncbi:MAG: N-acetylglucosamine-6-phosphate deacetylase [Actinobacteria bacterium]|nr:N-acetylglucosamine-6-phosphate deacetylase [Actinomycetota bacterium]